MEASLLEKDSVIGLIRDTVNICTNSSFQKKRSSTKKFTIDGVDLEFSVFNPASVTDSIKIVVSEADEKRRLKVSKLNHSIGHPRREHRDRIVQIISNANPFINGDILSGGYTIMDFNIISEINNCGCVFIHSLNYSGDHNPEKIFAYLTNWMTREFDSCMVAFTDCEDGNIITLAQSIAKDKDYDFSVSTTESKKNPNSGNHIFSGVIMNNSRRFEDDDYEEDDDDY